MPKSCNKVCSYSRAISDCVPLSSDGEERAGYISIPSINNNTTTIINIKPQYYFVTCGCFNVLMYWCSLADMFYYVLSWQNTIHKGDIMSKIDKIIKQKLLALPEYLHSPPMFGEVRVTRYLVLCVILYRSLLSCFFCPLRCMSFFDLRILLTPLVSSNSSCPFFFWPLCCLSFLDSRILVTSLVSSNL